MGDFTTENKSVEGINRGCPESIKGSPDFVQLRYPLKKKGGGTNYRDERS
jgi:hypothetical protein